MKIRFEMLFEDKVDEEVMHNNTTQVPLVVAKKGTSTGGG